MDQIGESMEALNGGRLSKPNSDFNRARNSKNSLYSSQQNLSQNRPGSTSSNFARSKFYGSQQNLQINKSSVSSASSASSMVDQNRNVVGGSNGYEPVDPWLNAWDAPNQPPPAAAPRHNNTNSNRNYLSRTSSAVDSAAQFRMPAPPASSRNGQSAGYGRTTGTSFNNNFVHNSNGNHGSSSSSGQYSKDLLSISTTSTQQQQQHRNNLNNNNNYSSDPWSGDSPFLFYNFLFPKYYCIYIFIYCEYQRTLNGGG